MNQIQACWEKLLSLNAEAGNDVAYTFMTGASDDAIAMAERNLGFQLPDGLRANYKSHAQVLEPWEGCDFLALESLHLTVQGYIHALDTCPPFHCDPGIRNIYVFFCGIRKYASLRVG